MTNEPRDLTSLDSESVIRFKTSTPVFTNGQNMLLSEDVVKNIHLHLQQANLGGLVKDGIDCMFMGDNSPNWKTAKLKLSVQLVLDEVDQPNQAQIYKNDFDLR